MYLKSIILKSFFLFAFVSLIFITRCKKDSTPSTTASPSYQSALDETQADIASNDAMNVADAVFNNGNNSTWYCANVTYEKITTNKGFYNKIIIDFGDSARICENNINPNVTRKGLIIISYTGNYWKTGFIDTIKFSNYFVDTIKVQGSIIAQNTTTGNNITWSVLASLTLTRPTGLYHRWNAVKTRQLINATAKDSLNPSKWEYSTTGSASGTNIIGVSYSATITSPLIKPYDCWWITQGNVSFSVPGETVITLNYGAGACDDNAVVVISGIVYDIII